MPFKCVLQAGLFRFVNMIMSCSSSQHKVFNMIIIPNSVNMVNNFLTSQISTKFFLHYKSASFNIRTSWRVFNSRMSGAINKYISSMFSNSTFPSRSFRPYLKISKKLIVMTSDITFRINIFDKFLSTATKTNTFNHFMSHTDNYNTKVVI